MLNRPSAAVLLAALEALFLLRVAGQLLVVMRRPTWLPAMSEWQSGLLPYPLLLVSQVVILGVMTTVAIRLWSGDTLTPPFRPEDGVRVVAVALVYAGGMVVRYAIRMARRPAERWFGGTIPIAFHLVLAAWLFVLGVYLIGT
jgi:hypothetical protein